MERQRAQFPPRNSSHSNHISRFLDRDHEEAVSEWPLLLHELASHSLSIRWPSCRAGFPLVVQSRGYCFLDVTPVLCFPPTPPSQSHAGWSSDSCQEWAGGIMGSGPPTSSTRLLHQHGSYTDYLVPAASYQLSTLFPMCFAHPCHGRNSTNGRT